MFSSKEMDSAEARGATSGIWRTSAGGGAWQTSICDDGVEVKAGLLPMLPSTVESVGDRWSLPPELRSDDGVQPPSLLPLCLGDGVVDFLQDGEGPVGLVFDADGDCPP